MKHRELKNRLLFRLWAWNKLRLLKHRIRKRTDGHQAEFLEAVEHGWRDGLTFFPQIEYITPPEQG